MRIKTEMMNGLQANVDRGRMQERNLYLIQHHRRVRRMQGVLARWKLGAERADREEKEQYIKYRYFRRMVVKYNQRRIEELDMVVKIRSTLLK